MKKSLNIKIGKNHYNINFPTVGQLMEIESLKFAYTDNKYAILATSGLRSNEFILDLADTIATFQTLIPEVADDYKITNWASADAFILKELVMAYKKQFYVWYKPLLNELYDFNEVESGANKED